MGRWNVGILSVNLLGSWGVYTKMVAPRSGPMPFLRLPAFGGWLLLLLVVLLLAAVVIGYLPVIHYY